METPRKKVHLIPLTKQPMDQADFCAGRLLIMTSNNPDALDAALTRPGRIDKKVFFGNMSKSAGKSIYMRLIGRSALAHDAIFTMAEIEQYANDFSERIPANSFTPAQVQNFLQGCRSDPLKALREVDAWVLENRDKPGSSSATSSSNTTSSSDANSSNDAKSSSDTTSSSDTSASIISHTLEMGENQATLLGGNYYGLSCD
jgi:SpoVK/Ycf46/Vps4 family AAA+-type ATPase